MAGSLSASRVGCLPFSQAWHFRTPRAPPLGPCSFDEFFQLAMRYHSFRELAGLQHFGSSVYSQRAIKQSFG